MKWICLKYYLLFCLIVNNIPQANAQFDALRKKVFSKGTLKKSGNHLSNMALDAPLSDLVIEKPYRVFGTEPSWLITKDGSFDRYYFNLLTDLVVGEYDINPETGDARNPNALKLYKEVKKKDKSKKEELTIIERANYLNSSINIHILVTYYGDYGKEGYQQTYYDKLLADASIQKNVIDSLRKEVDFINSNYKISESRIGILLDFKNIPPSDYSAFVKFVSVFSDHFKSIGIKLPPITAKSVGRIPKNVLHELNDYANFFIVEAHGFEELLNEHEVNRLFNNLDNRFLIERTFKYYADSILKPKVILELPYYGTTWEFIGNEQFAIRPDNAHPPLDIVYKDVGKSGKVSYNPIDTTMAFFRTEKQGQATNAYLFDDYKTLNRKYKWIDSLGCNGFGIWCLGYCSANEEASNKLWAAIGINYGTVKTGLGWLIAGFLTMFLPIGFIYALINSWEVRNAVAKHRKYLFRFLFAFIGALIIFFFCTNIIPRTTVGIFIGMSIVIGFFVYMKVKSYMSKVKKYQKYAQ